MKETHVGTGFGETLCGQRLRDGTQFPGKGEKVTCESCKTTWRHINANFEISKITKLLTRKCR